MTRLRWAAPLLLAACAMPPRTDDLTSPERAYETFRGAIARDEYDRAYDTLSDQLRAKFGLTSRGDFTDAWVVGGGMAVSAIRRSKAEGPPEQLQDGRVLLPIRARYLIFGRDVRLWLRPIPVVRVYVEGRDAPVFYQHVERLEVLAEDGLLGIRIDPELLEDLEEGVRGGRFRRFVAGIEWFLDDFEVGSKGDEAQ